MSLHSSFNFFQNFQSEAHTSPLKMVQNPKIVIFVTWSGQSPRLLVCSNLVIWGSLGTLDKCLCILVSIFSKIFSLRTLVALKNGPNPKFMIFVTSSCQSPWSLVCSNLDVFFIIVCLFFYPTSTKTATTDQKLKLRPVRRARYYFSKATKGDRADLLLSVTSV